MSFDKGTQWQRSLALLHSMSRQSKTLVDFRVYGSGLWSVRCSQMRMVPYLRTACPMVVESFSGTFRNPCVSTPVSFGIPQALRLTSQKQLAGMKRS